MPKETPKISKKKWMEEPLTRGKVEPIIKDLKEFITSTARATENVLGGKIEKLDKRVTLVEAKIEATQGYIVKMENRLSDRIDKVEKNLKNVETNLSEKIDKIGDRLESHEIRLSTVEEKIEVHITTHP